MNKQIDHIGIVVRSIESSIPFYTEVAHTEIIEEEKIKVAFIPFGKTQIELIEPLSDDCNSGKFLEKRGGGLHHICFRVHDIYEAMRKCKDAGLRLLSDEPKTGAHGKKIIFLDPKETDRVLIELSQAIEG
jgi:methylmalonyl-CoA/ethylmalonyl-CoA epimerase